MKIINQISIDFANTQALPRYLTVQGDAGRKIEFTLYSGGSKLEMTTGTVCLVKYRCSDGTGGCYDTLPDGTTAYSISGNTVTVTLAPQVLAKAGNVNLQITLIDGDSVLTTFAIVLHNHADIAVGTIPSEDYVNVENLTARALSAALRAEEFAKSITTCMVVSYESGSLNTATGAEASLSTRIRSGYFPNLSGTIGVTAPTTVKSRLVFYNADLSFHSSAVGFTAGSYQVSKDAAFARLIVGYEDDSEVSDVDALANMVAVYMPVEVSESVQPLTVTVTGNDADGYVADKTYEEIRAAEAEGLVLRCWYGTKVLSLVYSSEIYVTFGCVINDVSHRVVIDEEQVKVLQTELGGDSGGGVYVGTEEPTDPNVNVWINPEGDDDEPESGSSYVLPIATPETLGGVMPVAKTDEMTVPVGVDAAGGLWGAASGASGGINICDLLMDVTTTERVSDITQSIDNVAYKMLIIACEKVTGHADNSADRYTLSFAAKNTNGETTGLGAMALVAQDTTLRYSKGYLFLTPLVTFGEAYTNISSLDSNGLSGGRSGLYVTPWSSNVLNQITFSAGRNTMEVGARLRVWGVRE